jgi:hypothetical protein
MRPILEVLASFVKVLKESQKITQHQQYLNPNLWVSSYRNETDAVVDNLMMPNGEIDRAIFSIANLLKNHNDRVHVVWYDDLLKNPQKTISKILKFLNVDNFYCDFTSIKEVDKHDDLKGYGVIGLHVVRAELKKSTFKPQDYLSEYVIAKYEKTLDFLDN